jgi:hypothetical protein
VVLSLNILLKYQEINKTRSLDNKFITLVHSYSKIKIKLKTSKAFQNKETRMLLPYFFGEVGYYKENLFTAKEEIILK